MTHYEQNMLAYILDIMIIFLFLLSCITIYSKELFLLGFDNSAAFDCCYF